MALLESENIPLGEKANDFSLASTDGELYELDDFSDAEVLVIVFMCNHCPYVQKIWGELVDLQLDFEEMGVQFVGINPNSHPDYPEETMDKMKEYYEEYDMNFPYLLDESQEVARAYGAKCTPDIYVFNNNRKLAYHGRIENDELRNAIDALVEGRQPDEDQNPSMGCSIKWKD